MVTPRNEINNLEAMDEPSEQPDVQSPSQEQIRHMK